MTKINFSKYHGIGNDFIIVDARSREITQLFKSIEQGFIKDLCHRNFGIGADGLILIKSSNICDFRMVIYNSDGTEAEMCGNGIRCMIKYIIDNSNDINTNLFSVETLSGNLNISLDNNKNITVDMGKPIFEPSLIPTKFKSINTGVPQGHIKIDNTELLVNAVGMGNPHAVIEVKDLSQIPFESWGRIIENDINFPERTNVHFVKVLSLDCLEVLVWERSCGPTLACGTGACAVLASLFTQGKCLSKVNVKLPGGDLVINWPNTSESIFMTGSSSFVYSGYFNK